MNNILKNDISYTIKEILNKNWKPTYKLFKKIYIYNEQQQHLIIDSWINTLISNIEVYVPNLSSYNGDFGNICINDITIAAEYARHNNWSYTLKLFEHFDDLQLESQINVLDFWYGTYNGIV
jgi:hypothetical protein